MTVISWLHHTARAFLRLNAYLVERDAAVRARDEALADRDKARAEAAAARLTALLVTAEAIAIVRQAQQHAAGCRTILGLLIEPGRVEQCSKVRLRDEDEAWAFADRVQSETGVDMDVHKCRFCPRQPVTLEPFWHITHADPSKRGQRGKADPQQPSLLRRHVSPDDVARMRERTREDAS
jgi:hypothetical protein